MPNCGRCGLAIGWTGYCAGCGENIGRLEEIMQERREKLIQEPILQTPKVELTPCKTCFGYLTGTTSSGDCVVCGNYKS